MSDRLTIALAKGATFAAVVAVGECGRGDAPRLAACVETVAHTWDGRIELDLRGLERIDEHGVNMLVALRRRLGRRLRVVPSEDVARAVRFVALSERNRQDPGEDRQRPGGARR